MIHLSGPAVVLIVAIGYIGINTVANWIDGLFKKDAHKNDQEKK